MAFQVSGSFNTPFGLTVNDLYVRWAGLGIDVAAGQALVTLYGYVSADAYANKAQPVWSKQVQLQGEQFGAVATQIETPGNGGLSAVIYQYLRQSDPMFASATDA